MAIATAVNRAAERFRSPLSSDAGSIWLHALRRGGLAGTGASPGIRCRSLARLAHGALQRAASDGSPTQALTVTADGAIFRALLNRQHQAMPQIAVQDLSKTYRVAERQPGLMGAARGLFWRAHRDIAALNGVSFSLAGGELVGVIGPNGAGKSTLIKILCGILEPSSGYCEVDGLVPWNERVRHVARIGVVFGQRTQLWWDLPVIDSFALLRDIYRVPEARFRATAETLISLLKIERLLKQPVRQLSLGQRMRCDIAAAMLHSPSILFLDEPTIGLDANSKLALRDFIKSLNRDRGVTVILATHDMRDIEALAQRVLIIGNGRILRDGPIATMRAETSGERRLIVDFSKEIGDVTIEGVSVLSRAGRRMVFAFDPQITSAHALITRLTADHTIDDLSIEEPTIEELIAMFYTSHGAVEA
jgi:ABC-2 type transport system ATP-binding protein